ncbi:unnamed protein product [Rhizophagus irregularis]|uniref:Uncharacterized protein n=1 Tax=Rhizophagus irregularis TaxID=588596 RepID=A0A916E9Z0_9GLOM|nr:unnamed protein product [Rhizophagus irregularis]
MLRNRARRDTTTLPFRIRNNFRRQPQGTIVPPNDDNGSDNFDNSNEQRNNYNVDMQLENEEYDDDEMQEMMIFMQHHQKIVIIIQHLQKTKNMMIMGMQEMMIMQHRQKMMIIIQHLQKTKNMMIIIAIQEEHL